MTSSQFPMYVTIYGAAAVVAAIVAYAVASAKHRDASHWAAIAFIFPPAVLIALLIPTVPAEHRQANIVERKLRKYFDND